MESTSSGSATQFSLRTCYLQIKVRVKWLQVSSIVVCCTTHKASGSTRESGLRWLMSGSTITSSFTASAAKSYLFFLSAPRTFQDFSSGGGGGAIRIEGGPQLLLALQHGTGHVVTTRLSQYSSPAQPPTASIPPHSLFTQSKIICFGSIFGRKGTNGTRPLAEEHALLGI